MKKMLWLVSVLLTPISVLGMVQDAISNDHRLIIHAPVKRDADWDHFVDAFHYQRAVHTQVMEQQQVVNRFVEEYNVLSNQKRVNQQIQKDIVAKLDGLDRVYIDLNTKLTKFVDSFHHINVPLRYNEPGNVTYQMTEQDNIYVDNIECVQKNVRSQILDEQKSFLQLIAAEHLIHERLLENTHSQKTAYDTLNKLCQLWRKNDKQLTKYIWVILEHKQLNQIQSLVDHYYVNINLRDNEGRTPIIRIIELGGTELVRYLHSKGANIEATNVYGQTPLILAVIDRRLDIMKYLVDNGANMEITDVYGYTALAYAVKYGHCDIAEYLIQKGANFTCLVAGKPLSNIAKSNQQGEMIEFLSKQRDLLTIELDIQNLSDITDNDIKFEQSRFLRITQHDQTSIADQQKLSWLLTTKFPNLIELDIANTNLTRIPSILWNKPQLQRIKVRNTLISQNNLCEEAQKGSCECCFINKTDTSTIVIKHIPKIKALYQLMQNEKDNVYTENRCLPQNMDQVLESHEIIQFMARFPKLDVRNIYGYNVLFDAIKLGYINVVQYLINSGIDFNSMFRTNAIFTDVNEDKTDQCNYTPLLWACKHGHLDIVKLLTERGAGCNVHNSNRETALMYGAQSCNLQMVDYLVKFGGDINAVDLYGRTVLMWACMQQYNLDVIRYLLEYGANINVKDDDGMTPLMWAIHAEYQRTILSIDKIKYLVDNGANVNAEDKNGTTPLMMVSRNAVDFEIIRYLVERGAYVNAQDNNGNSVLMIVCMNTTPLTRKYLNIVQYLVDYNAKLDTQNMKGETALMLAVSNDLYDVVEFLVQQGVNLGLVNKNNQNVLTYAKKNKGKHSHRIYRFLTKHGVKEQ